MDATSLISLQKPPLLRLPPELRNIIYDLIVREPHTVVLYNMQINTHSTVGHPLAQTCRQLWEEFRFLYESEGPTSAYNVVFKCHNSEIFHLRPAVAALTPVSWRIQEVELLVDHDSFGLYGYIFRNLVWDEDPNATHGLDFFRALRMRIHNDLTIDDLETAIEDFTLDKPWHLSQGHDEARADERWSSIKSALISAAFQRDGIIILVGREYKLRRRARASARIRNAAKALGALSINTYSAS